MQRNRIIYVAGPMRGYTNFNFPAFDAAAERLEADGWVVSSPAKHDRECGFDETLNTLDGFDLATAFRWDMDVICHRADAIYMLKGWQRSTGATIEHNVAQMVGLEILYEVEPETEEDGTQTSPPPAQWLSNGEVRTTSLTGGEKGVKPARFDLIPARPLWMLAELYGSGALKYAERNWERGYEWSKSFGAMMRHAWSFWNGEDYCPDGGQHHLASVAWHAMALLEWMVTHPEFDDRPTSTMVVPTEDVARVFEMLRSELAGVRVEQTA